MVLDHRNSTNEATPPSVRVSRCDSYEYKASQLNSQWGLWELSLISGIQGENFNQTYFLRNEPHSNGAVFVPFVCICVRTPNRVTVPKRAAKSRKADSLECSRNCYSIGLQCLGSCFTSNIPRHLPTSIPLPTLTFATIRHRSICETTGAEL